MKQYTLQIDNLIHPLQLHTQLKAAFPDLYIDFSCTWLAEDGGKMAVNLERDLVRAEETRLRQIVAAHVPQPEPDPVQDAVLVLKNAGFSTAVIDALLTIQSQPPRSR